MTWEQTVTRRSALRAGAAAVGTLGLGVGTGAARTGGPTGSRCSFHQIDFVAGDPIETLGTSEDAFYGRQNRLIQYVHADGDDVVERDAWINSLDPGIRQCVTADPVEVTGVTNTYTTAAVDFRVADGCRETFSLAVYRLPDGEFSFDRQQRLVASRTGTFGPGRHTLTVGFSLVCPWPPARYEQVARFPPGQSFRGYGESVALSGSGDTGLVGYDVPLEDESGAEVLVETADGWTRQASFVVPSPGGSGGWAVSDDTALVASTVFVREGGNWTQQTTLPAAGPAALSESGDTALVGSDVFVRAGGTWTRQATLPTSGRVALSGSGDTAVVGSDVFVRAGGTWTQQATLALTPPPEPEPDFDSMALSGSGDTVVVGVGSLGPSGYAYVYERTDGTWTQQARLGYPDTTNEDEYINSFGTSVDVTDDGDRVFVGSPGYPDQGGADPAVYEFGREGGTWGRRTRILGESTYFGSSLAVSGSGDTVVVGAPGDDSEGTVGRAYVFEGIEAIEAIE